MGKAEDLAMFQNLLNEYAAALYAGDLSRLSSLWTDDVVAMPPNEPVVAGKEAVRAWHQNLFDQYLLKQPMSPDEVEISGDWALVRISASRTITPKAGGESTEDTLKAFSIFKRATDGTWKLHRCMWNSPLPG